MDKCSFRAAKKRKLATSTKKVVSVGASYRHNYAITSRPNSDCRTKGHPQGGQPGVTAFPSGPQTTRPE